MLPIVSAMQLLSAAEYTPLGPVLTGHEFPLLVQKNQVVYVAKIATMADQPVLTQLADHPTPLMPKLEAVLADNDCLVTVETLINGQTLAAALQANGAFSPVQVNRVARDLLQSLQHLEALGIVHRDLKLSNIMISRDRYYLIDVSAARKQQVNQSSDTRLLGTTGFAAPENYGFAQTDGRSDIYSLGIVLNCLLTGQIPDSRQAVTNQLTTDPQWLPVIEKATAIDPQQRYQTAIDMRQALPVQLTVKPKRHWPTVTLPTWPWLHTAWLKAYPYVKRALWITYAIFWLLIIATTLFGTDNWRDQLAFLLESIALVGTPVLAHLLNRWLYQQFPQVNWHRYRGWLRAGEVVLIIVLLASTGDIASWWGGKL